MPVRFRLLLALGLLVPAACTAASTAEDAGTLPRSDAAAGDSALSRGDSARPDSATPSSDAGGPPSDAGPTTQPDLGPITVPGDAGPADITVAVTTTADVRAISPFIYGANQPQDAPHPDAFTLVRQGGNRLTAYNWENNASNAGTDYQNQSDDYLGGGNTPGEVPRAFVAAAHGRGQAALVTVPIVGYVAADKNGGGDVNQTPNYLMTRFRVSRARKGSALSRMPDLADGFVNQDEFVAFLEGAFPGARADPRRTIFYSLDNEPDLWSGTHPRIHPNPVTYAELAMRSRDYAAAIKANAPGALVFGSVNYGFAGYANLQNAPDANGRDYLEFFLDQMRAAETSAGQRLVDVLDLHFYSEARGDGQRITDARGNTGLDARLQAPRSLWDPTYREDSWIVNDFLREPIRLIPRLQAKIAAHYPGTKLSFSEHNHGGGDGISGAIATADVLGIFGREGVFAATYWALLSDESYAYAAYEMFTRLDGAGLRFGDTSVRAMTTDVSRVTAYAATDTASPGRVSVVLINKTNGPLRVALTLAAPGNLARARVFSLTAGMAAPRAGTDVMASGANAFSVVLAPRSVNTLIAE